MSSPTTPRPGDVVVLAAVMAASLFFIGAVATAYLGRNPDPEPAPLDSARRGELGPSREKHAMGLWLVEHGILVGQTRAEVIALLGEPVAAYAHDPKESYQLRSWTGGDWRLVLELEDGRVVSAQVGKFTW